MFPRTALSISVLLELFAIVFDFSSEGLFMELSGVDVFGVWAVWESLSCRVVPLELFALDFGSRSVIPTLAARLSSCSNFCCCSG